MDLRTGSLASIRIEARLRGAESVNAFGLSTNAQFLHLRIIREYRLPRFVIGRRGPTMSLLYAKGTRSVPLEVF
jgi:hypothetical protein